MLLTSHTGLLINSGKYMLLGPNSSLCIWVWRGCCTGGGACVFVGCLKKTHKSKKSIE